MLVSIELDFDFKFSLASEDFGFLDGKEPDFIKGVWSVADKFPEEDLFLGVERVDNDIHQSRSSRKVPSDFGLELELFFIRQDAKAGHDDH